jgi:RimJ/RimL family protein N-acetyltransferase
LGIRAARASNDFARRRSAIRELAKKLAKLLLGDYSVYYIYGYTVAEGEVVAFGATGFRFAAVEKAQVEASRDPLIVDQAAYHGRDSHAYACLKGNRIVGLCYFWHGERYRERNFWPLTQGEAKLVQIVVVPSMRGKSIASNLIACAAQDMFHKGFRSLYARIWHSNESSWRAFRRAGWRRIAVVGEARPLRRLACLRVTLRTRRRRASPVKELTGGQAALRDAP